MRRLTMRAVTAHELAAALVPLVANGASVLAGEAARAWLGMP